MNFFEKLLLILFLFISFSLQAQFQSPMDLALRHLEKNFAEYDLTQDEIKDLIVKDITYSEQSGLTNIYFYQSHNGIEAYNGIINAHITKDGKVLRVSSNAISNYPDRLRVISNTVRPVEALRTAMSELEMNMNAPLEKLKEEKTRAEFGNSELFFDDVIAKLVGYEFEDKVVLSWSLQIQNAADGHLWNFIIDANSGEVIAQKDFTTQCSFGHAHTSGCNSSHHFLGNQTSYSIETVQKMETMVTDGSAYKVFAVPAESPSHGPHVVVNEPSDPAASPFGWHDTNGVDGPEFTTLRGNNVEVRLDRNADNNADGPTPDGGPDLQFIFDYDITLNGQDPVNESASLTNLFYMINVMHDFSHHYGFDEKSGNFQSTNYSGAGAGSDHVIAFAQYGASTGSPDLLNNANFATPGDGQNGSTRMYLWDRSSANLQIVNVISPSQAVSGYTAARASFGGDLEDGEIEAEAVLVDDGSATPSLNCNDTENDIDGKIAIIDRGVCEFGTKILNAEQAGAVAAIVCNYQDGLVNMGAGREGSQVTIPGVFITKSDCDQIKLYLDQNPVIRLAIPDESGPDFLTGEFDNGIIAHEFGHGISNRLTGGPTTGFCLGNEEQMGEGWSDFMTLALSTSSVDAPGDRRGIGTYVTREANDGRGIRTYPYSADKGVNPHTYDNIITESIPHGVGSVWNAMLWDLYWKMSEEHGFQDDLYNGTGGNNMAIQLVFEGMKMQVCEPGFVDGRDAILAADVALYDGANQCLIWQVFADRGLGFSATQGSNNSRLDGVEAFDMPPSCSNSIYLSKTSDKDLIVAGEEFTITIEATNYVGAAQTNVVIDDAIPTGAMVDEGSITIPYNINGSVISFSLGDLAMEETKSFSYTLISSFRGIHQSEFSMHEDWENGRGDWNITIDPESGLFWTPTQENSGVMAPYSGENYWISYVSGSSSIQQLFKESTVRIPENNPVIRFFHKYWTEMAQDGGIIEISNDGGNSWDNLDLNFFRRAYRGYLQSPALPGPIRAFWGQELEYIGSYADLGNYAGQDVLIRFSLGSNFENVDQNILFWMLDDVDIFSMFNYNSEACARSAEGASFCTEMPERGVIVEPVEVVNNEEIVNNTLSVDVSPNPAVDDLNINMVSNFNSTIEIQVLDLQGRIVTTRKDRIANGVNQVSMDVSSLSTGAYVIKIEHEKGSELRKIIKK